MGLDFDNERIGFAEPARDFAHFDTHHVNSEQSQARETFAAKGAPPQSANVAKQPEIPVPSSSIGSAPLLAFMGVGGIAALAVIYFVRRGRASGHSRATF